MWFYTTNPHYYSPPVPKPQSEKPIGAFEGHLSYDVKPRLWFSLDGNFWFGGVTSLSGIANPATRQTSSRIGITAAVPLGTHQSVKVSYNNGAYIRFGGNYQSVPSPGNTPGSAGLGVMEEHDNAISRDWLLGFTMTDDGNKAQTFCGIVWLKPGPDSFSQRLFCPCSVPQCVTGKM